MESSNATLSASNSSGDVINMTKPDYGVYLCYANNSYGTDSQNVTLNVQCRLDFSLFIFCMNFEDAAKVFSGIFS